MSYQIKIFYYYDDPQYKDQLEQRVTVAGYGDSALNSLSFLELR